jgi:hypothetical protein
MRGDLSGIPAPETAVALLSIVFPDMDAVAHIPQFSLFLSTKPGLKRVTLDEVSGHAFPVRASFQCPNKGLLCLARSGASC